MRTRDSKTLTALRAARQFLHEYAHALPAVVESGLVRRLDDTISTVDAHVTAQVVHTMDAHSHLRTQQALRMVLRRDHMRRIVRVARADLPHSREFRVLRMPAGRVTVDQLAAAARAMAGMAARFIDTFVAAGLPPSFVDDAHSAVRALLAARDAATLARASAHGATQGIEATIVQGRKLLRALDSRIASAASADAVLVAHWQSVIAQPRLGRPRKRKRGPS